MRSPRPRRADRLVKVGDVLRAATQIEGAEEFEERKVETEGIPLLQ